MARMPDHFDPMPPSHLVGTPGIAAGTVMCLLTGETCRRPAKAQQRQRVPGRPWGGQNPAPQGGRRPLWQAADATFGEKRRCNADRRRRHSCIEIELQTAGNSTKAVTTSPREAPMPVSGLWTHCLAPIRRAAGADVARPMMPDFHWRRTFRSCCGLGAKSRAGPAHHLQAILSRPQPDGGSRLPLRAAAGEGLRHLRQSARTAAAASGVPRKR